MNTPLFSRWRHRPIRRVRIGCDTVYVALTKTLAAYAAKRDRDTAWCGRRWMPQITDTLPLTRIRSSFNMANRLASPALISITNTSMYVQMNVPITFRHLPKKAFHGAYSVNENNTYISLRKYCLIVSMAFVVRHRFVLWIVEIMLKMCSAAKFLFQIQILK